MKKYIIIVGMLSALTTQASSYGGKVRLLGGLAPTGVTTKRLDGNGNNVEVKQTQGKVFGIGFDINVSPRMSIGAETLFNDTSLLSLGFNL